MTRLSCHRFGPMSYDSAERCLRTSWATSGAGCAAEENRPVVARELAAAAENPRTSDQARPVLASCCCRRPSDAAPLCRYAAQDRVAIIASGRDGSHGSEEISARREVGEGKVCAESVVKATSRALGFSRDVDLALPGPLETPGPEKLEH
jgi:hypothetical protein